MAVFLANLCAILGVSFVVVDRFYRPTDSDVVARAVAFGVVATAQVVGVGLLLGYLGALSLQNLLLVHSTCLAGTAVIGRARLIEIARGVWRLPHRFVVRLGALSRFERALVVLVGLPLAGSLFAAAFAEPVVHDALSCGLSRVAYWLQTHSIRHFTGNEMRHNYRPINADLTMLWFVGATRVGYSLSAVPQFLAGTLALVSAVGFARDLRLPRFAIYMVIPFALSMPNFFAQLSTSQSDVFAAGFLSAGIFLLRRSVMQRDTYQGIFGWTALAIACGTKATFFFWGPGLLVLVLFWIRAYRIDLRACLHHAGIAIVAFAILASPRYLENLRNYGHPLGPPEAVAMHDAKRDVNRLDGLGLNLITYGVQTLEPVSNPAPLRSLLRPLWRAAAEMLPMFDPYAVDMYPRQSSVLQFGDGQRNADTVSTGLAGVLLPFAGFVLACGAVVRARRRGEHRPELPVNNVEVMILGVTIVCFVVFFGTTFLWWPVNWRSFNVLFLPITICAVYALSRLPMRASRAACGVMLLWMAVSVVETFFVSINAGVSGFRPSGLAYMREHQLQRYLADEVFDFDANVGVLLPWSHPLAGFFRGQRRARITFLETQAIGHRSAEDLLRDYNLGTLVALPDALAGRHGHVAVRRVSGSQTGPTYRLYSKIGR